jgi:putative NADH-flavin reductase
MRILIFGAAGRTGRELVVQALADGHSVTAFVRTPAKLAVQHSNLRVVQGDVTNYALVERAISGQDAVLCALGSPSPLRSDPGIIQGVSNILRALEQTGVRRFIYQSFIGAGDGRDQAGPIIKHVLMPLVLRHEVADHARKERMIRQQPLDWTIVRAPTMTNGRRTGAYRYGERVAARSLLATISRADVADFMLQQLTDSTYVRRAPALMY